MVQTWEQGWIFPVASGHSARVRNFRVNEHALVRDLLKRTSRSFYLTLRVLPGEVRYAIGLAY
ncbi:MAG: hypothetical protein EPO07_15215, partial [Verrucomicrobia bacterium]